MARAGAGRAEEAPGAVGDQLVHRVARDGGDEHPGLDPPPLAQLGPFGDEGARGLRAEELLAPGVGRGLQVGEERDARPEPVRLRRVLDPPEPQDGRPGGGRGGRSGLRRRFVRLAPGVPLEDPRQLEEVVLGGLGTRYHSRGPKWVMSRGDSAPPSALNLNLNLFSASLWLTPLRVWTNGVLGGLGVYSSSAPPRRCDLRVFVVNSAPSPDQWCSWWSWCLLLPLAPLSRSCG